MNWKWIEILKARIFRWIDRIARIVNNPLKIWVQWTDRETMKPTQQFSNLSKLKLLVMDNSIKTLSEIRIHSDGMYLSRMITSKTKSTIYMNLIVVSLRVIPNLNLITMWMSWRAMTLFLGRSDRLWNQIPQNNRSSVVR